MFEESWPKMDHAEVESRYPNILKIDGGKNIPWYAWLSSCVWNKKDKSLFLGDDALNELAIPASARINLVREFRETSRKRKVMVIKSEHTSKWHGFVYDPDIDNRKRLFFKALDDDCPVLWLILER